jgi:hypothetical protein
VQYRPGDIERSSRGGNGGTAEYDIATRVWPVESDGLAGCHPAQRLTKLHQHAITGGLSDRARTPTVRPDLRDALERTARRTARPHRTVRFDHADV